MRRVALFCVGFLLVFAGLWDLRPWLALVASGAFLCALAIAMEATVERERK